jgi:putative glutamine amidotransferase
MSDNSDSSLPPAAQPAPEVPTPDHNPPAAAATQEPAAPHVAAAPYVPAAKIDFSKSSSAPAWQMPDDTPWKQTWRVFSARLQSLSDQVGRRLTQRTLKIGVSARIFHPEAGARGLQGKTLQYLEESIAQWVMSRDVLVLMIPTVNTNGLLHPSKIRLRDYAKHLDGLVLQGGADVAPQTYSQTATRPEWSGDSARDMYELELLHEFVEAGKPVLGICRGCQLINVAFGGTLYQDIASDVPEAKAHVNDLYDSHRHAIQFPPGSSLASVFPGQTAPLVNSIHHQAVRDLGRDLMIEAISEGDNIIEAVRHTKSRFVMGLQWHPEFHRAGGSELLDCTPILDNFLRAARETRF